MQVMLEACNSEVCFRDDWIGSACRIGFCLAAYLLVAGAR